MSELRFAKSTTPNGLAVFRARVRRDADIALEAGVPTGVFYRYFDDKHQVFRYLHPGRG